MANSVWPLSPACMRASISPFMTCPHTLQYSDMVAWLVNLPCVCKWRSLIWQHSPFPTVVIKNNRIEMKIISGVPHRSTTVSPQPQSFPHYQISDGRHGVQNAITTVGIVVGIVQLWSILLPPNHVTPQTCCFGRHVSSSSFPFTVVQKGAVTAT